MLYATLLSKVINLTKREHSSYKPHKRFELTSKKMSDEHCQIAQVGLHSFKLRYDYRQVSENIMIR